MYVHSIRFTAPNVDMTSFSLVPANRPACCLHTNKPHKSMRKVKKTAADRVPAIAAKPCSGNKSATKSAHIVGARGAFRCATAPRRLKIAQGSPRCPLRFFPPPRHRLMSCSRVQRYAARRTCAGVIELRRPAEIDGGRERYAVLAKRGKSIITKNILHRNQKHGRFRRAAVEIK